MAAQQKVERVLQVIQEQFDIRWMKLLQEDLDDLDDLDTEIAALENII